MAHVRKSLWIWLSLWVFLIAFSKHQIDRRFEWRYPPLNTLVMTEHFAADVGAVLAGAHRVAADIAYVQFLQYYGVREGEDEHDHDEEGHGHHDIEAGIYPRLYELGRRIARLDPFFNGAVLEVAGSLAFNQQRIDESLKLLQEAIELDPAYYRYRLYAAAILYRNEGQEEKLIDVLAEAIRYPDCPFMLKNILANLYKKKGRYVDSARVRIHMIQTAPSASDREQSELKLIRLLQEHPDIRAALTPQ